jgi:hypothetical protein
MTLTLEISLATEPALPFDPLPNRAVEGITAGKEISTEERR